MSRARAKSPEAVQQQAVLEWLQAVGICAFRMNSGFHLAEDNGKTRAIRYGVSGMADILAFPWLKDEPYPRAVWIEMKSATGSQTPEQRSFQRQVEDAGIPYLLARCVVDVERWMRDRVTSSRTLSV